MIRPPPPFPHAPKKSTGVQACKGPTTGYRDGTDGVVETKDFKDGWIPSGWFANPIGCSNCSGDHATTKYVKVG